MNQYRQDGSAHEPHETAPTEAWIFAQAILGKPIPEHFNPQSCSHLVREELQRQAQYSPRHAAELRRLEIAEREALSERKALEFAAKISDTAAAKLAGILREETEEQEAWRRAQDFATRLRESQSAERRGRPAVNFSLSEQWNEADHPRRPAGTSKGGEWAPKGDAGNASMAVPVDRKSRIKAIFVSTPGRSRNVGHHWVPKGVVFDENIRPFLSDDAAEYAMGAFSGDIDPSHNGRAMVGIKHTEYSANVKEELDKFFKKNGINKSKKMTGAQMQQFARQMEKGVNNAGKPHPIIGPFNKAVKAAVKPGTSVPSKMDEVLAAGRKYINTSRFKLLAMGAVLSGILSEAVAAQAKILEISADSGHFRKAVEALDGGDIDRAHRLLTSDTDSLYFEILTKVGFTAAQNFRNAMDKAFDTQMQREYK